MLVSEIKQIIEAEFICGEDKADSNVESACGSDMMSDVLAYVKDQGVLLTGLVNPQVIRTAEMMDMHVIVFVRVKMPDEDMIELAKSKHMAQLSTKMPMYIACGKLYSAGLGGGARV